MLRSNTKVVKERIKNYIIDGFNYDDYMVNRDASYNCLCNLINDDFSLNYRGGNRQNAFSEWCAGLPSIFNTLYYYNVSAVDLLGEWLEETEEEKAKYNERQAEKMISNLLYREIMGHLNK